jgi:hypothetical protein
MLLGRNLIEERPAPGHESTIFRLNLKMIAGKVNRTLIQAGQQCGKLTTLIHAA